MERDDSQSVTGNGRLPEAIAYIKNHHNYMLIFLENGHRSLCNNPRENYIRSITVGC